MSFFSKILTATPGDLITILPELNARDIPTGQSLLEYIAKKIRMQPEQIILALGFNHNIRDFDTIANKLGYDTTEVLAKAGQDIYITDIYKKISLDHILVLYQKIKDHEDIIGMIQHSLKNRVQNIETQIEKTVHSGTIDRYKIEMKAIYADNIAHIDFAEARLNSSESGFRALLNEACIIAESRLIPIGEIFFRNSILPEEKRKLLNKKLIPISLVESRLQDHHITRQEENMLKNFLAHNKNKG